MFDFNGYGVCDGRRDAMGCDDCWNLFKCLSVQRWVCVAWEALEYMAAWTNWALCFSFLFASVCFSFDLLCDLE